jgi:hypothetical protein
MGEGAAPVRGPAEGDERSELERDTWASMERAARARRAAEEGGWTQQPEWRAAVLTSLGACRSSALGHVDFGIKLNKPRQ